MIIFPFVILAVQAEIRSIRSQQRINQDDFHRQMILNSFKLLCQYLLILENFVVNTEQTTTNKKHKRSNQALDFDWSINERDEILQLFTDLIQLDIRQYWHETERLEDQDIGGHSFFLFSVNAKQSNFVSFSFTYRTIVDVCLTIIRNNQFSSRTRTVKDYLSFILAVTIGLFRIEEGTHSAVYRIVKDKTLQ